MGSHIWLFAVASLIGGLLALFLAIGIVHPRSAAIAVAPPDQVVTVNGFKTRFRSHGDRGPAVVLLHGFGGSLDVWEDVIAQGPEARYYSLDLLGFGGSDRPVIDYSLEAHRRHVVALMDAQGLRSVILVGHSMGGSIAAWTAAKSGERVSGLMLLAPGGYPGSLKYDWPAGWFYRPGFFNRVAAMFVHNRAFGYLFPTSLARQGIGITATYDEEFARALAEVRQPVLLAWSTGDRRVPYAFSQRYLSRLANARLRNLPESVGHDAPSDSKDVADGLKELLQMISNDER